MSETYIEESRLATAEVSLGSLLPPGAWRPALRPEVNPRQIGDELWSSAFDKDQLDDRPLYWQRLILAQYLRELGAESSDLLEFELASRGMLGNQFSGGATYRVLVTGFDPFHLDDHIEQGNPSGVVALQHQHKQIVLAAGRAEIRSMIFPVRYKDFDEFLVERVLETFTDKVDMVTLAGGDLYRHGIMSGRQVVGQRRNPLYRHTLRGRSLLNFRYPRVR